MAPRVLARNLALLGVLVAFGAKADPSPEDTRRAKVVAKVGTRTVTVGELEDRLASVPPWQQAGFGATKPDVVKGFLDRVIVQDLVLVQGADDRGLAKQLPTEQQLKRARSTATLRAVHKNIPQPAAISEEDVRRYYDENKTHFDSPERMNLWRILVPARDQADVVLAAAKAEPSTQKYNDLARQYSIDKATNQRGGNLGFVGPDGVSNEAGVKVDPALVKAAAAVTDGSFVATPVPEGDNFAIVWRRSTVPAAKRSLDEASAQIRTTLYRQRIEGSEKKLIDDLRAVYVTKLDEAPLAIVEFAAIDAGINLPRSVPKPPGPPPK